MRAAFSRNRLEVFSDGVIAIIIPSLTANVYTDPKLLDVAGAVASLPDLPLTSLCGPAAVAR